MTDYDADDDRFVPTRFDTFNGLGKLRDPERDDALNFAFTFVPDTSPGAIIISDFMTGGVEHQLAPPQDVVVALVSAVRAIAYDWRRRQAKPGDRPRDCRRRVGRAWRPCLACSANGWIVVHHEWGPCPGCLMTDAAWPTEHRRRATSELTGGPSAHPQWTESTGSSRHSSLSTQVPLIRSGRTKSRSN